MHLSNFEKANHSQQNLPQEKQTLIRLVNNTHDLKSDGFLTEISVSEDSHCSLIELTMHWTDGSKKEATSELRRSIVHPSSRYYVRCIPKQSQLARANVEFGISITNAAKLDILRLLCVPKPELGSLVK